MSDLRSKFHSARSKFFRRASARFDGGPVAPSSPDISDGRSNSVPTDPASIVGHPQRPSKSPILHSNQSDPQLASITTTTTTTPATLSHSSEQLVESVQPAHETATRTGKAQIHSGSPELLIEAPTPELTPTTSHALSTKPALAPPASLPTPASPPASAKTAFKIHSARPQSPESALTKSDASTSPLTQPSKQQDISLASIDYFGPQPTTNTRPMANRKVWIKRTGASPTLVQISADDLVDDVRDKVLRKYANSLGRTFDAPDVSVRIIPREKSHPERSLGPEEPICNIIDAYYPGGQTIEEALLIDVPRRRTPQPSPRIMNHMASYFEDNRPLENGPGYFPPMPPTAAAAAVAASPHPSQSAASHDSRHSYHDNSHAISVLETGQLPVLPSPREKRGHHRPKYSRHHTSSPTIIASNSHSANSNQPQPQATVTRQQQQHTRSDADIRRSAHGPAPPPLPTPPAPDMTMKSYQTTTTTPPLERVDSPRLAKSKKNRKTQATDSQEQSINGRKSSHAPLQAPFSFIEATIPPINVLIVEDNVINLRLLEAFTRRLRVRWETAMNGRDAVTKWKAGGFHLVLMDIQLPIMSGLEATKEIRRLERVNGIGVFAKSQSEDGSTSHKEALSENTEEKAQGDDKLGDISLFKSPVIIVALTASSLQSDRHEALAAGCNDFLTKPVLFPWLERKVMEWGCMQALIDFDGWRKWKDLAAAADEKKKLEEDADPELKERREKKEAKRAALLQKFGTTS